MSQPENTPELMNEHEEPEELNYDDIESMSEAPDLTQILGQFFIEPKKQRNVVEVLCEIKRQMEVQNQLMTKLVEAVVSKS